MGVYDAFYRLVLYPILDRHGAYQRTLRMERALDAPLTAIVDAQAELLRSICLHASTTSPFWRERFQQAAIQPDRVSQIQDITGLPLLEKDDLRRDLSRIRSEAYGDTDVQPSTTGGSTAAPMPFVRDRECLLQRRAGNWLMFGWLGRRPWHRSATIWGAPRDLAPNQGVRERLSLRLRSREILLPSTTLDEQQMLEFSGRMRGFRPQFLHGYSQSVALFSAFLRDKGLSDQHSLSGVSITAEAITPEQKRSIEETFQCRVLDIYGSREFGYIAASCDREQGLHINPFNSIVEVLRPDGSAAGPGEPGQIVITDLLNRATPFIRYRTGDIGILGSGPCSCGRPMNWMELSAGRETDFIITPERRLVSGVALAVYVSNPGIASIQLRQERLEELEVLYVRTPSFGSDTLHLLESQIRKLVGDSIRLAFQEVPDIPLAESGKFVYSRSQVARRYFRGEPLNGPDTRP